MNKTKVDFIFYTLYYKLGHVQTETNNRKTNTHVHHAQNKLK